MMQVITGFLAHKIYILYYTGLKFRAFSSCWKTLGPWPIFWEFTQYFGSLRQHFGSLPNTLVVCPIFGRMPNILGVWPKNWDFGQRFWRLTNIFALWPIFWEIVQYFGTLVLIHLEERCLEISKYSPCKQSQGPGMLSIGMWQLTIVKVFVVKD